VLFIAAWVTLIIALIGLLLKKPTAGADPINRSRMMIYVGWLTSLAIIVTSGMDATTRHVAQGLLFGGLGFLIVDSGRHG